MSTEVVKVTVKMVSGVNKNKWVLENWFWFEKIFFWKYSENFEDDSNEKQRF